ncbi:MAG: amidase [Alphaproteobacteria bacterium]|nr:amidase [Alphaproteobacteria bacterium]
MVSDDLRRLYAESDGTAIADLIRRGDVAPAEVVDAAIDAIERVNPRVNAVVHKAYDAARAAAKSVPRELPFAGVPFLIKELATMWEGQPLTNSSRWMKDVTAPTDSEFVRRLKAAGFILIGKSNAPENGWAITTEPKLYGATHNPWRDDVTPGGSSGGSAAAVAARLVPLAEGSDGAGSIRVPASCCGLVGLKPSRGRVSLSPFGDYWYGGAYFLCLSRTVRDTAAFLDAMAGHLPGEPYTPPRPQGTWRALAEAAPERLRIGVTTVPPDGSGVHPEVTEAVRKTTDLLRALGHAVEPHDLTFDGEVAWQTYTRMTATQTAQTFDTLAQLVGRAVTQADVEPVTWAVIERGRAVSGVQHAADVESLRVFSRELATDLVGYDVFVTPTLTQLPRPLGYWDMGEIDIDRYNAKWTDAAFMAPFNWSGLPAISLAMHVSADGLPIGVQFVGRYGDEATLLALASALEQELRWHDRRPPVAAISD